jgi:hypothetical protein
VVVVGEPVMETGRGSLTAGQLFSPQPFSPSILQEVNFLEIPAILF